MVAVEADADSRIVRIVLQYGERDAHFHRVAVRVPLHSRVPIADPLGLTGFGGLDGMPLGADGVDLESVERVPPVLAERVEVEADVVILIHRPAALRLLSPNGLGVRVLAVERDVDVLVVVGNPDGRRLGGRCGGLQVVEISDLRRRLPAGVRKVAVYRRGGISRDGGKRWTRPNAGAGHHRHKHD